MLNIQFSALAIAAILALASASPQATTPTTSSATATGTLGLGAVCSSTSDCANGADCYGVTSGTITTCGSFQGSCETDDQCATNTCVNGLCGGFLASSLYRITSTASSTNIPSATGIASSFNASSVGTGSTTMAAQTATTTSATSTPLFTGGATREKIGSGLFVAAMVGAWAL
ncbi:hypothetical protein BP5796_04459 [Coleophoma crateriformis]|uniref:GPI anchored protein n=1 Tax=Coleophoma crateriformis TaxID=565419 RepID=A0A3D8SB08_9HELO|nr:hypothetical protein BP5796_04459 [Coleophoma crateriformis]